MGGPAANTSACDTEFIHVAVTRPPQTQSGVVEAWATDLDAAVEYVGSSGWAECRWGHTICTIMTE